ncbi:TetR family transcriptional regulator [Mycobacterium crocinum]|uniref:TetR/AcrR family transcriptional regulator n=1 Tax=Mycolicibacterium crocinum TaxID=388459 RepID=A0ABY3TK67_9MYCO|nr:TetR/AcrR family transcriptional regulator [Mycolicibacterium crocinum]MCV7216473.1 TetR family transcriptional regulator [Mycolicibacterium crocinum]ULN41850.1 TetR/AcrR family transcriptional regulator [Mycolicibacterium crocinum]
MATVANREAYFETGLEVLADVGYGGLKLAEVCNRLGVTTGSFYHYFTSWPAYTRDLVSYWVQDRTVRLIGAIREVSDPRRRIEAIIEVGLSLPHGAEAAIRSWASVDPYVRGVQTEVDKARYKILYDSALEIVGDERQADVYAAWAVYVFVGYEQATLPREPGMFGWIARYMLDALDSGSFASVPR